MLDHPDPLLPAASLPDAVAKAAAWAERAQRIGASLAITDRPDGGTSVAVDLPITTPAGSAALPPPDAPGSTAPRSAKRRTALEGADS